MTPDEAHHLFEYRGGALYWRNPSNPKKTQAGTVAGTRCAAGYIHIQHQRKIYKAHRLIFLMHNGYMPSVLDHIDGDKTNDRVENLREATHRQNASNAARRVDNQSGVKNVCWHKRIKKWGVSLSVNRQLHHFGYYDDLEFASLVAYEARTKHHGDFARHK